MPAGEDDVALVAQAFHAFPGTPEGLDDYYARYWHPDGVIEFVDGWPLTGSYQGIDGYKRWFEDSYGPYEDVNRRLDSIHAEGDVVVALMTLTGHPKDDDVELEVHVGNTYEVEDGRIRRLRVYVGHDRALEAARAS